MRSLRQLLPLLIALVTFALALTGCPKPKPPTLVPKAVQVLGVDPQGITVEMTVEMTNPNGFALSVQSVKARVLMADGSDLGEVNVVQAITLPPSTPTLVKVPMTVRWSGVNMLGMQALSGKDLPFTVKGTVGVGGEKFFVDVPYSVAGVVTQEQLKRAAINSLGKLPFAVPTGAPR